METREKPLKRLVYWIAPAKSRASFSATKEKRNIRRKTRKECLQALHRSYHWQPQKITIPYRDLVDLVDNVCENNDNPWER